MKRIQLTIFLCLSSMSVYAQWIEFGSPLFFTRKTWSIPVNIPAQTLTISNVGIQEITIQLAPTKIYFTPTILIPTKFTIGCCFFAAMAWYFIYRYKINHKKRSTNQNT